jgi:HEAT repeat protein
MSKKNAAKTASRKKPPRASTPAVTVPPELRKWPKHIAKHAPTEAFRQLKDTDPSIRLEGAKWIAKQAHGAANNFTEYWLKHPGTTDRLMPVLNDPNPLVVEEIIGAITMIVSPRSRKDDRPVSRAIELLRSDRPNIRSRAAMLLTHFDNEGLADALLPLFNDPDKSVRALVIAGIASAAFHWSPAVQERVRRSALERLDDRTMDVRIAVAKLMITVGKEEDIKTLKNGLKKIKGYNYRQDYRESIEMLEEALRAGD